LFALSIIALAVYACVLPYDLFISKVAAMVQKNGAETIIKNYVSASRFELIQLIMAIGALCSLIAYFFYLKNAARLALNFNAFLKNRILDAKALFVSTPADKIIFNVCLLFLILHTVYYVADWPLQYDECWSYNYFVNKNIFFSFLTPNNNHNGFTLLSWFSTKLPIPTAYALRAVALIFGVLSLFAYRKLSALIFDAITHKLSLLLYTGSLPLLYYSIIARGYSATVFFTILGLICLQKIATNSASKKAWYYLALTQALGMFFNPVHFYAAATIYIGTLVLPKEFKTRFFIVSIMQCAIYVLLLLGIPLLLLNGYKPLAAAVSKSLPFVEVVLDVPSMLTHYFTGVRNLGIVFYIFCALLIILFLKTKNRQILFCLIAVIVPIVACVLQGQVLYERTFTYLVPIVSMGLSFIIAAVAKNKNVLLFVGFFLMVTSIYSFRQHSLFMWNIPLDKAIVKSTNFLLDKNLDSIYLFDNYAKPGLIFYASQANKNLYFQMAGTTSLDYTPFDSNKKYKCIITNLDAPNIQKGYAVKSIDSIMYIQY
jgi:hypothetical protein